MKHVHLEFSLAKRKILFHDGPIWEGTKNGKTKFVLFSQYRTGSTLLRGLLNCHPSVQCDGEVFNEDCMSQKVLFPCFFLEERVRETPAQAYGVELKPDQIQEVLIKSLYDPKRFLPKLNDKGWRILHLKRRNILRQALSNVIAIQRKKWHPRSKSLGEQAKIRIDCNRVLQEAEWMEKISVLEEKFLQQIPHATFVYEDDLLNPERHQGTADRIFDILSLPSQTVKANVHRLSSNDLSSIVNNYSELEAAARRSKFAKFLDM